MLCGVFSKLLVQRDFDFFYMSSTSSLRSKLLVMTWMCGAARKFQCDPKLRRVLFAAACPGAIASDIARNTPYCAGLVTFLMKIFFPSPYKAAAPVVWLALADEIAPPPGHPIYYQHLWQAVCFHSLIASPSLFFLMRFCRKLHRFMPSIQTKATAFIPTWMLLSRVCCRDCIVEGHYRGS